VVQTFRRDELPLVVTASDRCTILTGNYRTNTRVYITDDDLASRKTGARAIERRTGGENQARDTSNSFINGLSQREYLRARFSALLGNRKMHQPDAFLLRRALLG
jgi:hypothetical protein